MEYDSLNLFRLFTSVISPLGIYSKERILKLDHLYTKIFITALFTRAKHQGHG